MAGEFCANDGSDSERLSALYRAARVTRLAPARAGGAGWTVKSLIAEKSRGASLAYHPDSNYIGKSCSDCANKYHITAYHTSNHLLFLVMHDYM